MGPAAPRALQPHLQASQDFIVADDNPDRSSRDAIRMHDTEQSAGRKPAATITASLHEALEVGHFIGLARAVRNANGVLKQSPRLAHSAYLGSRERTRFQPQRGCVPWPVSSSYGRNRMTNKDRQVRESS